jgi:hypothetical protein
VFRRNSHPPTSGGGTKAESKLRSVLTAIDESHSRPSNGSTGTEKGTGSPDTPTNRNGINGQTRSASDHLGSTVGVGAGGVGNWGGHSLDPGDESEDETNPMTPKHSDTFMPSDSPSPTPTLKGHDREASRTPTAEPVVLPT